MTGHRFGAAVCCAAAWLGVWAGMGCAYAEPAAPSVQAEGGSPGLAAPGSAESRIWIEPLDQTPGQNVSFHVRYAEEQDVHAPLSFECEIRTEDSVENGTARMAVTDASDAALYEGEVAMPALPKGLTPCEFKWNAEGIADGCYVARFELLSRHDRRLLATQRLRIVVLSRDALQAALQSATEEVTALVEHLQTLGGLDAQPAYPRMRLAVAADSLEVARHLFEEGDWRRADKIVEYVLTSADSVRCQMALAGLTPELMEPVPRLDLSALERRDGLFVVEGRPVFLVGGFVGDEAAGDVERLARYGLNLAVVRVSPEETLGEPENLRERLDALFTSAERLGVTVSARLAPADSMEWLVKQHPELRNTGYAGAAFDLMHPVFRGALERHYESIVPYLAGQRAVNSLCILEQPRFHMGGEEVRQGFISYVQGEYADRDAINRAWQARMRDLDEIDIWWDYEKPAYQYDLQTYNYELGTKFVASLASRTRQWAAGKALYVECADTVFEEGESLQGVDREALTELFEINACSAGNSTESAMLAMGYPHQALNYALLRSFAPDKPLFNLENRFLLGNDRFTDYTYAYVHTLMWEGAMHGLSATAAPILAPYNDAAADIRQFPQCLEAYAAGCLDLNRLAPLVAAFQQAPAEIAILWSLPSKIIDNGVDHLTSIRTAFEGISWFGYPVRFITERECIQGELSDVGILVIPETPAVSDRAFSAIAGFIRDDRFTIRVGNPMPYGPHREARHDMLDYTANTILIRNAELPTSFLHAMDTAFSMGALESIPRPINPYGFPLEAVKTLYLKHEGAEYLYVLNLRKEAASVCLFGGPRSGRDLIHAQDVRFPAIIEPLTPMLVRLEPGAAEEMPLLETADAEHETPSADVLPVVQEKSKR